MFCALDILSVVNATAAVVSAIGVVFATLAAFRSATSACRTQEIVASSERRVALRQVGVSANEVLIETKRVESRANDAKSAYRTLAIFSNAFGSPQVDSCISAVDMKAKEAAELSDHAKPYASDTGNLDSAEINEINSLQTRLYQILSQVRALREDLEREHAYVDAQCAQYRENVVCRPTQQ